MPLDRTWFDTLVDDIGDNLTGTFWNKAAVDALMDAIDAALAALGPWVDVAYSAGNFTGSDTLVWGVDAGDQRTFKYRLLGQTISIDFTIGDTDVSGAGISLILPIPGGKSAKAQRFGPLLYSDAGGANVWGYWLVLAGGNQILCRKLDNSNWAVTAGDATSIFGYAEFEVN